MNEPRDWLLAEMECYILMLPKEPRVKPREQGGSDPAECADAIIRLANRVKLQRRESKRDCEREA